MIYKFTSIDFTRFNGGIIACTACTHKLQVQRSNARLFIMNFEFQTKQEDDSIYSAV
jgi:hypothetical protein